MKRTFICAMLLSVLALPYGQEARAQELFPDAKELLNPEGRSKIQPTTFNFLKVSTNARVAGYEALARPDASTIFAHAGELFEAVELLSQCLGLRRLRKLGDHFLGQVHRLYISTVTGAIHDLGFEELPGIALCVGL